MAEGYQIPILTVAVSITTGILIPVSIGVFRILLDVRLLAKGQETMMGAQHEIKADMDALRGELRGIGDRVTRLEAQKAR